VTAAPAHSEQIVAASPSMKRILRLVRRIAPTESNILLTGESGTGKEKVARLIHYQSNRSRGPFVAVNMAAIPATLIESELFGHVRGAFTDAKRAKRGFFELADGGTIFLDEIAETPPPMQGTLLRVLQEREVQPVGAEAAIRVDARVIAATNRDLREEIAAKRFREDLYYRLNVFRLHIPPLRERKEDIPYLVRYFLERQSERHGKRVGELSDQAWGLLMNYDYPGNVRELENAIERAVILGDEGETVKVWDLPPEIADGRIARLPARAGGGGGEEQGAGVPHGAEEPGYDTNLSLEDVEARHIRRVIAACGGNLTRAARRLGISRTTLWRKVRKYGIQTVS
jgi:transcriptional regulator with PAS, ATPase and Fis domain